MKILLINTSDYKGGAAIACRRLADSLNYIGANVKLLVRDKKHREFYIKSLSNNPFSKLLSFLLFLIERLSFVFHEKSKNERFLFSTAKFGRRISSSKLVKNSDIVHLHWINSGFLSLKEIERILKLNKPVIWTLHDAWIFTGGCHLTKKCEKYKEKCNYCPLVKNPSENDISAQLWQKKFELINKYYNIIFITCSNWLKEKAKQSKILKNKEIFVIQNSLSKTFLKILDKKEVRKKRGINLSSFCILYGAINYDDTNKGFEYFVKSLEILQERYAGNTNLTKNIQIFLFGKSEEKHVSLIPYPVREFGIVSEEELVEILTISDILIFPSLEENLPNTIMEAFACQTPVIAFRTGGIPEMIDHLEDGYLAEPFFPESLTDGIVWALTHNDLVSCGIKARIKAEKNYTPDIVANKHINLYNQVIFSHYNRTI